MILPEWAKRQGVHPQSASRWLREGTLPVPATKMGKLILVGDLDSVGGPTGGRTVLCARVSQVGPAPNAKRRRFLTLLGDASPTTILVEHRDRRLVVTDDTEVENDLVRDLGEVLTSFCARLSPKRSARHPAEKALEAAASKEQSVAA